MKTALLLLLLVADAGAAALETPAPAGPVDELWFRVSLAGEQVGHSRTRSYADAAGRTVVDSEARLALNRGGTVVTIDRHGVDVESSAGRPLFGWLEQRTSGMATLTRWRVEGERLVLEIESAGSTTTRTLEAKGEILGLVAGERALAAAVAKGSPATTYRTVSAEAERVVTTSAKLVERKPSVANASARFDVSTDALPGMTVRQWVDPRGREVRSEVPILGMTMLSERVTRELALGAPSAPPELLFRSGATLKGVLREPFGRGKATYRVTLPEGSTLLEDSRQQRLRTEPGGAVVYRVGPAPEPGAVKLPLAAPEPGALEPGPYVQSDDPELRAKAKEVAGDEKDPRAIAKRLAVWVGEHVEQKQLGVGFASAKEVFASRAGDCTEHAVLLAALLRAAGIPARVATGLVYSNGIFLGHMWTEAWLGAWVPLDATIAPRTVGPGHLKLGDGTLNDGRLLETFYSAVRALGELEIELLSFEP